MKKITTKTSQIMIFFKKKENKKMKNRLSSVITAVGGELIILHTY